MELLSALGEIGLYRRIRLATFRTARVFRAGDGVGVLPNHTAARRLDVSATLVVKLELPAYASSTLTGAK